MTFGELNTVLKCILCLLMVTASYGQKPLKAEIAANLKIDTKTPSYIHDLCNSQRPSPSSECIKWFRDVINHCEIILRVGKLQAPPSLLLTEPQTQTNELSIKSAPESLSSYDCKSLLVNMAIDYVRRDPEYELQKFTMHSLITTIWLITIALTGGSIGVYGYQAYIKNKIKRIN